MSLAGRMDKFTLDEISLVDNGAQAGAKAVIAKRADPVAEDEDDYAMPAWSPGEDWLTRATMAKAAFAERTSRIATREGLTLAKAADKLMRSRAGEALVTAMR